MKTTIKTIITGLAGFVLGAFAMYWFGVKPANQCLQNQAQGTSWEYVDFANLLRQGEHEKVLQKVESVLPAITLNLRAFPRNLREDLMLSWKIREYYEKHEIPFPESIREYLTTLPPQPPSRKSEESHSTP